MACATFELDPPCPIDHDQLLVYGDALKPAIAESELADASKAFQLDRLREVKTLIQRFVERRQSADKARGDRLAAAAGRGAQGPIDGEDPDEELARTEKVAALEELYASRISVLIGPAGTGKTTLLRVLCDEPSVDGGNVLLLAPTGKARVRLGTVHSSATPRRSPSSSCRAGDTSRDRPVPPLERRRPRTAIARSSSTSRACSPRSSSPR